MKNAEQKKYSISEFAKACGTTKDTLYHYEKQGLLIPAFDENNHYRMYSSADFHLYQYIAHLRRMGFSVSEIRESMENRNVTTYLEMLSKSRQQCLDEISELQHRYSIITSSFESTSQYQNIPLEVPGLHYEEETLYYSNAFSGKLDSLAGISQIQQHLSVAESLMNVTSNITVFRIMQQSLEEGHTPKFSLMIQATEQDAMDPEHLHRKPAGSYLQMFFKTDIITASDEDLYRCARILTNYAAEHNYKLTTDYYAITHVNIFLTDDPDEYLTEFQVGIE